MHQRTQRQWPKHRILSGLRTGWGWVLAGIAWINIRVLARNGSKLTKSLDRNACNACPRNRERNTVSAAIWHEYLHTTRPSKESAGLPPGHTIIIEADMSPTTHSSNMINMRSLRRRILDLGDDRVKHRQKLVDPWLRCYTGAFFVCNPNKGLTDKGAGNGTQCWMILIKLKKSYMWKIWNNTNA